MRKKRYQKALAVSGLLALAGPSMAQERASTPNQSDTLEEVVVTGIRGSLQRNLDMKRESSGVVDVISSEDIGKFPDSNVAASLQRVPGVSIQRSRYARRADRHHRARLRWRLQRDAVRWPTHLDGDRRTLGGLQHRRCRLRRRLDVMKTPGRHAVEQLHRRDASTFSIRSLSITPACTSLRSASGSMQDESGDIASDGVAAVQRHVRERHDGHSRSMPSTPIAPRRPIACSSRAGKAAISRPASSPRPAAPPDRRRPTRRSSAGGSSSTAPSSRKSSDKRIDGRIAFQWRPPTTCCVTIDDNYSRQKIETETYGFALWFGSGDLRSVQLDEQWHCGRFRPARHADGSQREASTSNVLKTNQTGLNFKFDASDNLSFDSTSPMPRAKPNPDGEGSDGARHRLRRHARHCALGVRVTGRQQRALSRR